MAPKRRRSGSVEESPISTMAVSLTIADQVRKLAKQYGISNLECINALLQFAIEADLQFEVKQVSVTPKKGAKRA